MCYPISAWLPSLHRMNCACFSWWNCFFNRKPHLMLVSVCSLISRLFGGFPTACSQISVNVSWFARARWYNELYEQRFGERNTQFYHFLVVTLPKKLLQEISVLSVERFGADNGFCVGFSTTGRGACRPGNSSRDRPARVLWRTAGNLHAALGMVKRTLLETCGGRFFPRGSFCVKPRKYIMA